MIYHEFHIHLDELDFIHVDIEQNGDNALFSRT
jgi:hypothetical protein